MTGFVFTDHCIFFCLGKRIRNLSKHDLLSMAVRLSLGSKGTADLEIIHHKVKYADTSVAKATFPVGNVTLEVHRRRKSQRMGFINSSRFATDFFITILN